MAKDFYSVDEFIKTLEKMSGKFGSKAEVLIAATVKQVNKTVKQKTPRKTGNLRKGWREMKPKEYKDGTVLVGVVKNYAPHGHLYEEGHMIIRGGKTRKGKRTLNTIERNARGIKTLGKVEGKHLLQNEMKRAENSFFRQANEMLCDIVEED